MDRSSADTGSWPRAVRERSRSTSVSDSKRALAVALSSTSSSVTFWRGANSRPVPASTPGQLVQAEPAQPDGYEIGMSESSIPPNAVLAPARAGR